nr:MAG TPA: tail protein [Caudoviricetes sp.]
MLKEVDISVYLPEAVKHYREIVGITEAENPELTMLWTAADSVFLDQFIETLTDNGCKRWEKILDIKPRDTDTLQVRRFRIKARINEDLPYTWRALEKVLDTMCGKGAYAMTLYNEEYRLVILLELTVKKLFDEVEQSVKRMIPANLILDVRLRYNTWGQVKVLTWGDLKNRTWKDVKEEVL